MSEVKTETIRCYACDVPFSLSESYIAKRRSDGFAFYCPNGHQQHFKDSFRERTEKAERDAAFWEAEAQRLLAECDRLRGLQIPQLAAPTKKRTWWPS